jgi:hypothetical protein
VFALIEANYVRRKYLELYMLSKQPPGNGPAESSSRRR